MSAARELFDLGVGIEWEGAGRLVLVGLDLLDPARAREVLDFARENKARLLEELAGVEDQSPRPATVGAPARRKVTPAMLSRFRTAKAWLLPRLPNLLAAGWTRRELFGIGRQRYPFGAWGVAWSSAWGDPNATPALAPGGVVRWEIREPHRVVTQRSRPMEAVCAS
jgi:hypothetical protein